jgi:hypothetical protein
MIFARVSLAVLASTLVIGAACAQSTAPATAPAATPAPAAKTTPAESKSATSKSAESKSAESKSKGTQSAASLDCSKQADAKGLHGKERKKFRSECKKSEAKPN